MHCAVTQSIHCLTKSRDVIDIVNRLGFGSSYNSMKRDDIEIAQMDIDTAGKDRCPVNDCIEPGIAIQGAVDNFNHKERTDSGGEVSNDTVLVIWQNGKEDDIEPRRMSKRDTTKYGVDRKRSLQHTLP